MTGLPDRRVMVARATAEALTESLRAAMVEIVEQTNDTVVGAHARPSGADAARITARTLEAAVAGLVNERAPASDAPALKRVARVELGRAQIKVTLAGELPLEIVAPILLKHRSNAVLIQPEGQRRSAPGVDRALVRALALATDWAHRLTTGEAASIDALARDEQRCERYVARILPLAYLAPDLVAQIVQGRQPQALTLAALIDEPLPLTWAVQRRRFATFD